MEGGSIFLIEPVSGIERQEFDFGSFGQIGWLVDDKSPGLLEASASCDDGSIPTLPPLRSQRIAAKPAKGSALDISAMPSAS